MERSRQVVEGELALFSISTLNEVRKTATKSFKTRSLDGTRQLMLDTPSLEAHIAVSRQAVV